MQREIRSRRPLQVGGIGGGRAIRSLVESEFLYAPLEGHASNTDQFRCLSDISVALSQRDFQKFLFDKFRNASS